MDIYGWRIYAHPLLIEQLERLTVAVEKAERKDLDTYHQSANTKVLAMLTHLIFDEIPQDPSRKDFRQGGTLGAEHKHWFRAKFGNGRFRLFFRFDSRARVIIFAWVNDQNMLRTYGSKTDAYAVFRKMLDKGNPPGDWQDLLEAAKADETARTLEGHHKPRDW